MWDEFIHLEKWFHGHLDLHAERYDNGEEYEPFHTNKFYQSDKLELGHISIIDKREEKGMWMMHVAAFAKPEYAMPIFGFDVICGKKKVTGCFHDISPTAGLPAHCTKFLKLCKQQLNPTKPRELPPWAKEIFSENMIAVGQPTEDEISLIKEMAGAALGSWMGELQDKQADKQYVTAHETAKAKYCENQLKNDNSRNVMVALGMDEQYVKKFKRIQFPY
jgi:phycocyanobilin:ferredoxin oxidoreductase